jgi:hypothetical protein
MNGIDIFFISKWFCLLLNVIPDFMTGNSLQKTGSRGTSAPNFGLVSFKFYKIFTFYFSIIIFLDLFFEGTSHILNFVCQTLEGTIPVSFTLDFNKRIYHTLSYLEPVAREKC